MTLAQYTKEQLEDMSLIDMAYVILENNNKQTVAFTEIMDMIVAATGLSQSVVRAKIAQFYTDMNIDGRFLCMGDNKWGLRSWYPVEQAEEDTITQIKPKKKKVKKLDDDFEDEDLDDYDDLDEFEEEDLLDDDEEIFDELEDDDDAEDFEDEDIIDDEEVFDEIDDDLEDEDDEEEDLDLELEEEDEDL